MLKKGQLEIMGLVVVVILVSLGMLFLLRFVVFQPAGEERAAFTRSRMADSTLRSILQTTTDCRSDVDLKIVDLIQDCVDFPDKTCENNLVVCDFLEDKIGLMMDSTLKKWKKGYNLTVSVSDEIRLEVSHQGCLSSKDNSYQPLSRNLGGLILIRMEVCE